MSEVQLDQDIYETIRAGITEGGNSFEQARWVIDSLTDAGYKITRPTVTPADTAMEDAVNREGTDETGTTDAHSQPVKLQTSSTTDGDAETLAAINWAAEQLDKMSQIEDVGTNFLLIEAKTHLETLISAALQSTRKPPVLAQQGWVCPHCNTAHNPKKQRCECQDSLKGRIKS